MRLVAGPSLKVVLWKRVHRVENWVSNLFKYYFFFLLAVSSRRASCQGSLCKKVGSAVVDSAWVGGCGKKRCE